MRKETPKEMLKETSKETHRHHFSISYPVKLLPRLYSTILTPLIIVALIFLAGHFLPGSTSITDLSHVSVSTIILAIAFTFIRLFIACMLALIAAIPLSVISTSSASMERILLSLFDIVQSVPVLAFFPILVLFFVKFNFLDGAAVFIIFLSMLWN